MRKLKRFSSKLKLVDLFGRPIQLSISEKEKYQTIFGAMISLAMISISVYFSISLVISWLKIDNPTTIYSTENYSVSSLLNENKSIEYIFDNKNFYIYFAVYAVLPNKTELNYQDLERYFNIEYRYAPNLDDIITTKLISETCYTRIQKDFLNLEYDEEEVLPTQQNSFQMCVQNPFAMGIYAKIEYQGTWAPALNFQISQCKNNTENSNFCASLEEIKNMSKYVVVQASIPKTIYDFKNTSNPIKRMYKYEYYSLDWDFQMKFLNELNPTFLYTDYGLFNDDYRFHSLNFNPEKPTLNLNMKNNDSEIMFQYRFIVSFQTDKYYIRNLKLNDIIGSLGGIMSILYTIGGFLCISYNRFYLDHTLINSAFRFENFPKTKKSRISMK